MLREKYENRKLKVGIKELFHIRPGSVLDCAMSFSEKAPTKSLTSNLPYTDVSTQRRRGNVCVHLERLKS